MKNDFLIYLTEIELSEFMVNIVKEKYLLLTTALGVDELDDIYISETISNQGTREYFSLWGFALNIACKTTVGKGDKVIEFIKLSDSIRTILFEDWNYDLITPSVNSRIKLKICNVEGITNDGYAIHSSGVNCSKLLSVNKKYFIPVLGPS